MKNGPTVWDDDEFGPESEFKAALLRKVHTLLVDDTRQSFLLNREHGLLSNPFVGFVRPHQVIHPKTKFSVVDKVVAMVQFMRTNSKLEHVAHVHTYSLSAKPNMRNY